MINFPLIYPDRLQVRAGSLIVVIKLNSEVFPSSLADLPILLSWNLPQSRWHFRDMYSGHRFLTVIVSVPAGKSIVIFLAGKQRAQTGNFKLQLNAGGGDATAETPKWSLRLLYNLMRNRSPKQMRIFRCNCVLIIEI